jgi:hypothetical protein
MLQNGDTYSFEFLPTLFVGTNEYGRLTFVTGSENLTAGDYAVVQVTRNGTKLVQSLRLEKYGTAVPEYTMLTLELRKEELPEPLEISYGPSVAATPAAERPFPSITESTARLVRPQLRYLPQHNRRKAWRYSLQQQDCRNCIYTADAQAMNFFKVIYRVFLCRSAGRQATG